LSGYLKETHPSHIYPLFLFYFTFNYNMLKEYSNKFIA